MVAAIVPKEDDKRAIARYHKHYREFFHEYARTYPGIIELITALRRANTSICTGSDRKMTDTTLEKSGLRTMFSTVVTADDATREKLDRFDFDSSTQPTQTIYIGNAARDIKGSKKTGIASAAVLWGLR